MRRCGVLRSVAVLVSFSVIAVITLKGWGSNQEEEKKYEGHRDYVLRQNIEANPELLSEKRDRTYTIPAENQRRQEFDPRRTSRINILDAEKINARGLERDYKTSLKTLKGNTTIYIHNPKIDMISSHLHDYGTWEEEFLSQIGKFFLRKKNLVFLDIGCNIGVYTMYISKLRTRCVGIDAVKDNLRLLSKSLLQANLSDQVTLIWNAISNIHTNVSLLIPNENVGGAHIEDKNIVKDDSTTETVETITLDDLVIRSTENQKLVLQTQEKIFIKLDIEGNEDKALSASRTFFQTVNVIGIFMEWMHHRYKQSGQTIVDVLVRDGFLPYDSIFRSKFLNPDTYFMWPENVFWLKR